MSSRLELMSKMLLIDLNRQCFFICIVGGKIKVNIRTILRVTRYIARNRLLNLAFKFSVFPTLCELKYVGRLAGLLIDPTVCFSWVRHGRDPRGPCPRLPIMPLRETRTTGVARCAARDPNTSVETRSRQTVAQ